MHERSRPFLPKTEKMSVDDLDNALRETQPPVSPRFSKPARMVRPGPSRTQRLLGAAALAFGGLVSHESYQHGRRTDAVTQEPGEEAEGASDEELEIAAATRQRVRVWQSYIKQLDNGERLPTAADPEDEEGAVLAWRRSRRAETDLLTEIGPEYRDEVMRRARKAAQMFTLEPEVPKSDVEVMHALDRVIYGVVQGATVAARDHGWKGLNMMRADSLAMQIISKEMRSSVDEHPGSRGRVFWSVFQGLRNRAQEKLHLELLYPDSHRAGRDPVSGISFPHALPETEGLSDRIFLDEFAWLGRLGGDRAQLEQLRGDTSGVRTLLRNGFLPWIERLAPTIRQDADLRSVILGQARYVANYDTLTQEQEARMRGLIRLLEP